MITLSKKYYSILLIILSFMVMGFVNASIDELAPVKQGECITLPQTCASCTWNNITYVKYPNGTEILINKGMTRDNTYFYYSFCNTSLSGEYFVNGIGNLDSTEQTWNYRFFVTYNGKETAGSATQILFIIIFIALMLYGSFLIINMIGHTLTLDFDILDLAQHIGVYFSLVAVYILEYKYFGDSMMHDFLYYYLYVGAFTNMFLPFLALFLTMTLGKFAKKNKEDIDYA